MEYASFTRYPQFTLDNTIQIMESNPGTSIATIYQYSDNQIEEIFSRPENYFRENFVGTGLKSGYGTFSIILQKPIELNHSWTSSDGVISEITDLGFEMETPKGKVQALEITRTYENSMIREYYGENIGLIKRVFTSNDDPETEITSTLVAFNQNVPEKIPVTIYSLDNQATKLEANAVTIKLMTNEPIRLTLVEYMKGHVAGAEMNPLVSKNTKINYMYLRHDGIAAIDLSSEFREEMNAGAGTELLILQGIVNTIGGYYNVNEVLLTVDGQPYESGHILFEKGQTQTVDYDIN